MKLFQIAQIALERKAKLPILLAIVLASVAQGEDFPFPIIEKVAERKLIGVDQHGYPLIKDEDKPRVANLAASGETPEHLRSYSIWGLAISGYSPESANGLSAALVDRKLSGTARGYAAMGLRNFTSKMPAESKVRYRKLLRAVVTRELTETPDGIIRTLIGWGDATWLQERFAGALAGHAMEIEILTHLLPEKATPRLLAIYRNTEKRNHRESYNRRAEIGRAMIGFEDKRGIDVLDALLDAETVPKVNEEPNHQYRHNAFTAITRGTGKNFGYKHRNYHPSIDEAIRQFRSWWIEHRYEFEFPESDSNLKRKNADKADHRNR